MSTNGENKNVGTHKGLWKLIDDDKKNLNIEIPMNKAVCAVHSSFLCYKDLCKTVSDVDVLIQKEVRSSCLHQLQKQRN